MLTYQIQSAWQAIRRFPVLSSLIVIAIALGLAATMSTATIVWRLSADPIPGKSSQLYYVMLDTWEKGGYDNDFNPPDQVTFPDAMALFEKAPAARQVPMYQIGLAIQPDRAEIAPLLQYGRATSRFFAELFDFKLIEGSTWSEADERSGPSVIMIERTLKEKLFGRESAIGKELNANNHRFKIIGVFENPQRVVRFYDVTQGALEGKEGENFLIPIRTAERLEIDTQGNNNCWKGRDPGFVGKTKSECIWLQYWAELKTPAEVQRYQQFIDQYAQQQSTLGRFPRTTSNNRLLNVMQHMQLQRVVSADQSMSATVGLGFLLVAMVNATCLLLAKFLRGSHTSAVHRALGAARSQLFTLHMVEAALLGLFSALLGTLFTALALWFMRWMQPSLAEIAVLDWGIWAVLIGTSLAVTLASGALPALRVSRLAPAASLRTN